MEEKEKQEVIGKYAKKDWKKDPENIRVLKASSAEGVFKELTKLTNAGYDEGKVVVVFPENYTLADLEDKKAEPEGTKWYLVYHIEKSKFLSEFSSKGA